MPPDAKEACFRRCGGKINVTLIMAQNDLTQGGILGNIGKFSVPYMLAYFLQILYGLADMFVIGQYCGVDSTTAVSNGAQIMHMFTVIIIGLAMGTTVRLARAIGAGDKANASKTIGNTFILFTIVAVISTILLLLTNRGIVSLLDVPAEAVAGTVGYLRICFLGIPFIIAYNIIASIFRGIGDSESPMYIVIVACVVNIALDYLFIGYFRLGPEGAALGTTLSQAISVIVAAIVIRKKSLLKIRKEDLRPERRTMSAILTTGIPLSLQDGFIQIAFIAITVIANNRGLNDAAAVGIVEKFIGLLFIVPSAMLATVSAVAAQNIGAGKPERARKTMEYAMAIAVGFGVAAAVTFQFIPEYAVRIFTNDNAVIQLGGEYLQGYVWDCIFAGIHFCFSGFFTACGYSVISFCHNILAIIFARIPLSYLASVKFPDSLFPMGLASPAGSLLSVLICISVYLAMRRKGKL